MKTSVPFLWLIGLERPQFRDGGVVATLQLVLRRTILSRELHVFSRAIRRLCASQSARGRRNGAWICSHDASVRIRR